ncbi:hypothetical protein JVU11DRAFT_6560 [Chiua virens]|nr:hypothetical protein JVU11DRAFT_6560 [Chiua virens]
MPFPVPSGHSNRFPSCSPPNRLSLYFPPGGHTHDRYTIPLDRLHISFSDPVLVAAEQRLSNVPIQQKQPQSSTIKDATATKTIKLGSVAFRLRGGIFSHRLRDHGHEPPLVGQALKAVAAAATPGPSPVHCWNAEAQATTTPDPSSLNSLDDDTYDICEVVTVPSDINGGMGHADSPASESSRHSPGLAPLASELFKEELFIRGYRKRPASRPPNDVTVTRKSKTGLMFVTRKVFPKVPRRCQGREVAECLETAQGAAEMPANGLDAHLPENQISVCVTLHTPRADGQQSPGTDGNTSASKSFDLHEFSYITAFTTPPSSPSMVLDGETSEKAVSLGEGSHAV